MGAFTSAVRHSVRNLARNPGFAVVTVLVLTLGIGATTTLFTLVNGIFLAPPPRVAAPSELVRFNQVEGKRESSSWPRRCRNSGWTRACGCARPCSTRRRRPRPTS